jgi:hypothetical protein
MKKNIVLFISLVLIVLAFTGCGAQQEQPASENSAETPAPTEKAMYLNIGTGGTSGTYYPLGGAFSEIWNNNVPNVNVTTQSTGGSVANINLLYDKKIEVALAQNDLAYYAYEGTDMFEGTEFKGLRALATLFDEPIQIFSTDMSVNSMEDIKGKKVSVGSIGSGGEKSARIIIAAAGLDFEKDIDARFLSVSETVLAMKDNQLDIAIMSTAIPNAGIQELSLARDVKLVSIDEELANKLKEQYLFYSDVLIPAGSYKNQTADAESLTMRCSMLVRDDMAEDLAYELTKQIYVNHDRVVVAHNVGKFVTPENSQNGISVPLHSGAERYFKEIGIIE